MRANKPALGYERNVFVNCPLDDEYAPLLRPLLFTILALGFAPRIATERSDSGESRIDKIVQLIRESRYSVHDISRLVATQAGEFSRFNLPFELGIDRGAQLYGANHLRRKRMLVLDATQYDYKRALSDFSGSDIKHHRNGPPAIVRAVRDWFVETVGVESAPGATVLWYRYLDFTSAVYDFRKAAGFSDDELNSMPVPEYVRAIRKWISEDSKA